MWYVKISYQSKAVNKALMQCIMYIGRYYGKNKTDDYSEGVTYLAKKVSGASKSSIRYMVHSKKIANYSDFPETRQWCFKKNSYKRAYKYIIYKLLNKKTGNYEEALELLHSLFLEHRLNDSNSNLLSDVLINEPKAALEYAINKNQYKKYQEYIEKFLKYLKESDAEFGSF